MTEEDLDSVTGDVFVIALAALLELGLANPVNALVVGSTMRQLGRALDTLVRSHGGDGVSAEVRAKSEEAAQTVLKAVALRCPALVSAELPDGGFAAPGGSA